MSAALETGELIHLKEPTVAHLQLKQMKDCLAIPGGEGADTGHTGSGFLNDGATGVLNGRILHCAKLPVHCRNLASLSCAL